MPLQIANSDLLDPDFHFSSTRLLFDKFPNLKDATKAIFDERPEAVQTYDCERDPVLYVIQGEMAIVSPSDETIELIMTDDTTTCITGIIRHRLSGVTCLTHYDRPLEDNLLRNSLEAILDKMHHLGAIEKRRVSSTTTSHHQAACDDDQFDLYLIGGYLDERNISEELATYLLATFHSISRYRVNLTCAFTGLLNTRYIVLGERRIPAPIAYGAAVNVRTGAITCAQLNRSGANHLNGCGIPLYDIRRASVSFGSSKIYKQIYEPESRLIAIQPIKFDSVASPEARDYFKYALRLKDQDILMKFSTSPYVEPAHFVSDNRSVFKFFLDHHKENITRMYFPSNKPRYFRHYQLLRTPTSANSSTTTTTTYSTVQYRWKECAISE